MQAGVVGASRHAAARRQLRRRRLPSPPHGLPQPLAHCSTQIQVEMLLCGLSLEMLHIGLVSRMACFSSAASRETLHIGLVSRMACFSSAASHETLHIGLVSRMACFSSAASHETLLCRSSPQETCESTQET